MRNVNSRSTSFNRVASVFASSDNRTKFVRVFVDRSVLDVIVVISNKIEPLKIVAGGNNPPAVLVVLVLSVFRGYPVATGKVVGVENQTIFHNLNPSAELR